jgi:hypothetical protein
MEKTLPPGSCSATLEMAQRELLINSLKQLSYGNAGIAQLVEQLICNQQVVGSNPTAGSSWYG